jgi:hypothetical protein
LAKWIAVITMAVDHYGKIVDPSLYDVTNAVGRLAYPLFAWIIGMRLSLAPDMSPRYLANLVPWAIVSQPVWVLAGKSWVQPNIFFTLVLGVAAHWAVYTSMYTERRQILWSLVPIAGIAVFVDYGVFGVATIPAIACLGRRSCHLAAWCLGPLGVLSNTTIFKPYFGHAGFYALLSSVAATMSLSIGVAIPRLPKQVFYAFYPAHIFVLYLIARW